MIPLLLGAAALVIGGKGVKKTVSAVSKMNDAKDMAHRYERRSKRAEEKREKAREQAGTAIGQLGETKMNILTGSLQTFVKEFRRIKNVDFRNSVGLEELRDFRPDSPALKEIAAASQKALEFSTGAVGRGPGREAPWPGSLRSRRSPGHRLYRYCHCRPFRGRRHQRHPGLAGRRSLAAGGLGIAGGTAVLGGIVAAPALLVAGIFLENKADEAMDQARAYREEVREFEERCDSNIALMDAIRTRGGPDPQPFGHSGRPFRRQLGTAPGRAPAQRNRLEKVHPGRKTAGGEGGPFGQDPENCPGYPSPPGRRDPDPGIGKNAGTGPGPCFPAVNAASAVKKWAAPPWPKTWTGETGCAAITTEPPACAASTRNVPSCAGWTSTTTGS